MRTFQAIMGLLLVSGIIVASAACSTEPDPGSGSGSACLPDMAACTPGDNCCLGDCYGGHCCHEEAVVSTCMCGGVAMGDCSAAPCGGLDSGSPDGDGGACQCVQQVIDFACP